MAERTEFLLMERVFPNMDSYVRCSAWGAEKWNIAEKK